MVQVLGFCRSEVSVFIRRFLGGYRRRQFLFICFGVYSSFCLYFDQGGEMSFVFSVGIELGQVQFVKVVGSQKWWYRFDEIFAILGVGGYFGKFRMEIILEECLVQGFRFQEGFLRYVEWDLEFYSFGRVRRQGSFLGVLEKVVFGVGLFWFLRLLLVQSFWVGYNLSFSFFVCNIGVMNGVVFVGYLIGSNIQYIVFLIFMFCKVVFY